MTLNTRPLQTIFETDLEEAADYWLVGGEEDHNADTSPHVSQLTGCLAKSAVRKVRSAQLLMKHHEILEKAPGLKLVSYEESKHGKMLAGTRQHIGMEGWFLENCQGGSIYRSEEPLEYTFEDRNGNMTTIVGTTDLIRLYFRSPDKEHDIALRHTQAPGIIDIKTGQGQRVTGPGYYRQVNAYRIMASHTFTIFKDIEPVNWEMTIWHNRYIGTVNHAKLGRLIGPILRRLSPLIGEEPAHWTARCEEVTNKIIGIIRSDARASVYRYETTEAVPLMAFDLTGRATDFIEICETFSEGGSIPEEFLEPQSTWPELFRREAGEWMLESQLNKYCKKIASIPSWVCTKKWCPYGECPKRK